MGPEIETILLYAGGALGLLFLLGVRGQSSEQAPAPPDWRTTGWAVLAFLVLFAISRQATHFLVGGDEYFRLLRHKLRWAEHPRSREGRGPVLPLVKKTKKTRDRS